jgi:hypothetical protein
MLLSDFNVVSFEGLTIPKHQTISQIPPFKLLLPGKQIKISY